jgi:hypothetical protein
LRPEFKPQYHQKRKRKEKKKETENTSFSRKDLRHKGDKMVTVVEAK